MSETSAEQISDLVYANRILFREGIVDAFGHVSARDATDPQRFLLARNLAPGLVKRDDVQRYALDGTPCSPDAPPSYLERFIHGAIYEARPDVQSIIHSHSENLIPFGVTGLPLRPVYHMAAFLGGACSHFDIRHEHGDTDLLIRNIELGRALANALGPNTMVLMRGHGSTVVGSSVQQAVYRAIFSETNARIQLRCQDIGDVTYLTSEEAEAAAVTLDGQWRRPWELWKTAVGSID